MREFSNGLLNLVLYGFQIAVGVPSTRPTTDH